MEVADAIENKWSRLQTLINAFEHQADSFLFLEVEEETLVSRLTDYHQYDHVDELEHSNEAETAPAQAGPSSHHHGNTSSDGSRMDDLNPEDIPIPLPSSLGWGWCAKQHVTSLAVKEARLRYAQASEAIHRIRLALGFKSALFRTQVRHARTQKTKTRAWSAVQGADTTVQEHACIYSMAQDAHQKLCKGLRNPSELLELLLKHLNVQTLILGSDQ